MEIGEAPTNVTLSPVISVQLVLCVGCLFGLFVWFVVYLSPSKSTLALSGELRAKILISVVRPHSTAVCGVRIIRCLDVLGAIEGIRCSLQSNMEVYDMISTK